MTNKKQYLFLFSIGPVQSFIVQARKTQDLYAGSKILSELIKVAIEKVGRDKIIFPFTYPDDNARWDGIESLPNRFMAIVDWDQADLEMKGRDIENTVILAWEKIAYSFISKLIMQKVDNGDSFQFNNHGINQQIIHHLDIQWLFEVYTESEDKKYSEFYIDIEHKLGAIKNVRFIEQYNNNQGEKGRKCDIDGERNVKFYRKSKNQENRTDNDIYENVLFTDDVLVLPFKLSKENNIDRMPLKVLQAGEGLSAVSFTKRCYKHEQNFPSTAKVALLNLYADEEISNEIQKFEKMFSKNDFDEQLIFEDNLTAKYFNKYGLELNESIDKIIGQQKQIISCAKSKNIRLSKFYALLSFDGDSMGEWLSKATNWHEHQIFSKLLIDFAQKATNYLNEGRGRTVYAGGDDFLGFVNLNYLFETIGFLKEEFEKDVTKKVSLKNGIKEFTISLSITIAHYKTPLQRVVTSNRNLLKATKEYFKKANNDFSTPKNGMGIEYLTTNTLLGTTFIKERNSIDTFFTLSNYFASDLVSPNLLFKYAQDIKTIIGSQLSYDDYLSQMAILQIELQRILQRSCKLEKKNEISEVLILDKEKNKIGLSIFLQNQAKEVAINKWKIDMNNFFSFIKISTKLSSELQNL